MLLSRLLADIQSIPSARDVDVKGLSLNSQHVKEGDLFIALQGATCSGKRYIDEAIAHGAVAVLREDEVSTYDQEPVPILAVPQLRQKLGSLAAYFYDYPAEKLQVIGVTGTSGKTSCTQFIAQCLEGVGQRCGIVGTLGSGLYGALGEVGLTTPESIDLQYLLSTFVRDGAKAAAVEVSSHGIDQGRVSGTSFEVGLFTNLSQDHLDYHGDMDTYASVKRRFFTDFPLKHRVINIDDAYGAAWIRTLAKPALTYSTALSTADIYAHDILLTDKGVQATVCTPWGSDTLRLPLLGLFNLSNALGVLGVLGALGIPFKEVMRQLAQLKAVPGRMQAVGGEGHPLVIVDYAHKPDALEKVLQVLRSHTKGRLICVFGCGGDRDRTKRPIMGSIAEALADLVIVTNDNPRHEKPEEIVKDIFQGFKKPEKIVIALDRSRAICESIEAATEQDCILIAGKGAEHYQQIGDEKFPFDDVEKAKEALAVREIREKCRRNSIKS